MKKTSLPKIVSVLFFFLIVYSSCNSSTGQATNDTRETDLLSRLDSIEKVEEEAKLRNPLVDSNLYRSQVLALANGDTTGKWPVKDQPIPLAGAILPSKRIIAYYGNLYSTRMGILGEHPPELMLEHLDGEIKKWNEADSTTEAIPALHYIAVVAQGSEGRDGKYRSRMPDSQIDSVLSIAKMRNALVFLDIQVALSTIEEELPRLEKYLKLPHVHLGIDPEFSMKDGSKPGKRIGSFNASDINFVTDYLQKLVQENDLPPKVLVVHRFTQAMVKNYSDIKLKPEVQFVMHMDGWGPPELKKGTYRHFIHKEPVEFTGFKIFYKNDIKNPPNRLLTPEELLKLKPIPIYIQYQ
jgi:hypothetical protein